MPPRARTFLTWLTRGVAVAAFVVFLATAFRTGWTQPSTDFPNYYTAAKLVRQRLPLRDFYDWTWFARQMNYAGFEQQLGGYTPQTPLTMLPMVALTELSPQNAKRAWLLVNLAMLAAVVYMLARVTGRTMEQIALLAFCGFSSLAANFIYGQYYVFLLFLITLSFYWMDRSHDSASGFLAGVTFALKLYTGPLLLFFLAKRNWRAASGMLAGVVCAGALSIFLFGWADVAYYLARVLPRTLEGGSIDPYNPGVPTVSTLLRHVLLREATLNPNPLLHAPWLFFFARTAIQLALITFATLGILYAKAADRYLDFAWFIILAVLLSTSTASYTFILLLAPVALLLRKASSWKAAYLIASYILLTSNLKPAWLFPKVWLLLLLFVVVGIERFRFIPARLAILAATVVAAISLLDARQHMIAYDKEPGRNYQQVAALPGSYFSSYPVITRHGLFFQAMGDPRKGEDGYLLCWLHGELDCRGFGGYALRPTALSPEGPVWFELVSHRTSTFMQFDPTTKTAAPSALLYPSIAGDETVSPNGEWVALTHRSAMSQQIWLRNVTTGMTQELAGGDCNNSSPVWELDSSAILFASDCSRAFGLTVLYRAPILRMTDPTVVARNRW